MTDKHFSLSVRFPFVIRKHNIRKKSYKEREETKTITEWENKTPEQEKKCKHERLIVLISFPHEKRKRH